MGTGEEERGVGVGVEERAVNRVGVEDLVAERPTGLVEEDRVETLEGVDDLEGLFAAGTMGLPVGVAALRLVDVREPNEDDFLLMLEEDLGSQGKLECSGSVGFLNTGLS